MQRRVLVTGAASGIGRAITERFVADGSAGVLGMAAFLAGPEGTYVSGSSYPVDDGASTKRYPDLPAAFARFAAPTE